MNKLIGIGSFQNMILFIPLFGLFLLSCQETNQQENIIEDRDVTNGAFAYQMYDPQIDDPEKPWSYSPKPTTVVGVPFARIPVQVTFDGAIFTGNAELAFFYGENLQANLSRQRTYLKGWIPIVQDSWIEKGIKYDLEMFGTRINGLPEENTLNFAKIKVTNLDKKDRQISIASSYRGSGKDHRYRGKVRYDSNTQFKMENNLFFKNDSLVYAYPKSSKQFAINGVPYQTSFTADTYKLSERSEVGINTYSETLAPDEHREWVFKMPTFPVSIENKGQIEAIKNADYFTSKESTIHFWESLVNGYTKFKIPEKQVNDAYRASIVHLILATRETEKGRRQGSGLPYDGLFLNDFVDMRLAYDVLNMQGFVEVNIPWLLDQQREDGMFVDKSLTRGEPILASHGQALFSLAHHFLLNPKDASLEKVYSSIVKGVQWIMEEHRTNRNGLLRTSIPYDNEMIKGHYVSHNLWGIASLRAAIRVAEGLNDDENVSRWLNLHNSYRDSILKAVKESVRDDNYLPTGFYEYEAGEGIKEYRTGQDWENNLLIYPSELLEKDNPIIEGTLNRIRKNKYREGVMTYRNGMHIHQYITFNQAQQYLSIGESKKALRDFYHILLHNGSVHEGFENLVDPWEDRDPHPSPSPHGWAAAKTVVFVRNMLVREYGGDLGLSQGERSLFLYSLIAPEWALNGDSIVVDNAPTEFGEITSSIAFSEGGSTVNISNRFHTSPKYIAIPIPYFKRLSSFESNAESSFVEDGIAYFTPDVTSVTFLWEDIKATRNYQEILMSYREEPNIRWKGQEKIGNPIASDSIKNPELLVVPGEKGFLLGEEKEYPAEHLSFGLIVKTYKKEYSRRFKQYLAAGKKPVELKAVPMLPVK